MKTVIAHFPSRLPAVLIVAAGLAVGSCGGGRSRGEGVQPVVPDTLRAVTMYGPSSYFIYRATPMGFDYENLVRFARDCGYVLSLEIAPNMKSMLESIRGGRADLAAYPIPQIDEYRRLVRHAGPGEVTCQVLVQYDTRAKVTDVTQLPGKSVYVEEGSKYHYRMLNLNDELGGGIDIVTIRPDTLMDGDLIDMVHRREIGYTVVDSDVADVNRKYYGDLDMDVRLSLDQSSSWAVRKDDDALAAEIDGWRDRHMASGSMKEIYRKYFEYSKSEALNAGNAAMAFGWSREGHLSPYDSYFKLHARSVGVDWRLLAAIGYVESRFDNNVVSWSGARGVMQLMPATARAMGIGEDETTVPERAVYAAARLFGHLDARLSDKVPDKEERMYFVLAAYNAGLGHILDAIALARKHGLRPDIWAGNVSEALLMKSRPHFYNDPEIACGYFRGGETVDFVIDVMSAYNRAVKTERGL